MAAVPILAAIAGAASVAHGVEQSRMMKREAKKQEKLNAEQNAKMESELAERKKTESIDKQNFLMRLAAQRRARVSSASENKQADASNVGAQTTAPKTLLGQ